MTGGKQYANRSLPLSRHRFKPLNPRTLRVPVSPPSGEMPLAEELHRRYHLFVTLPYPYDPDFPRRLSNIALFPLGMPLLILRTTFPLMGNYAAPPCTMNPNL